MLRSDERDVDGEDTVVAVSGKRSWLPVRRWGAVAVYLAIVQLLARYWHHLEDLSAGGFGGNRVYLGGWVGRDATEYLSIAADGYQQRQLVHFPLYPIAMNVFDVLPYDTAFAGVVVSAAGGLVAAVALWRWLGHVGMRGDARRYGLLAMLLYPYAWFLYGVVYSDALFIGLAVTAFLLVERDRLVWAGVVGAFATAARPSGAIVAIGLQLVALERSGVLAVSDRAPAWVRSLRVPTRLRRERFRGSLLAPLLSWLGLAAYMAYQWVEWGSPIRWVTEQSNYHQPGWRSAAKVQYFDQWYQGFPWTELATTTFQAVLLAIVVVSVPAVGRRFGWGYGVYVLLLAAMPAVSVATFMGTGRYLLAAFPCFALFGEWLAGRRRVAAATGVAAVVLIGCMAAGFSLGYYLT